MKNIELFKVNKIDESIRFLRRYEPPEGYFLGFSGGKDSIVLYDLAEKAGVKFEPHYSNTGIDPPELVKFIKRNYPDIIMHKPEKSFYQMIPVKGFPTKWARWCCDYLKKRPTNDVPLKMRLMGVRAEESSKRAKRGPINKYRGQTLYSPIFHWLEWEIWEYIDEKGLKYPSLYDEGFGRIGCIICPFLCNLNSKKLEWNKKRWPKQYAAFERAMKNLYYDKEWWRQTKKRYALSYEEFIENWYNGNQNFIKRHKNSKQMRLMFIKKKGPE